MSLANTKLCSIDVVHILASPTLPKLSPPASMPKEYCGAEHTTVAEYKDCGWSGEESQ